MSNHEEDQEHGAVSLSPRSPLEPVGKKSCTGARLVRQAFGRTSLERAMDTLEWHPAKHSNLAFEPPPAPLLSRLYVDCIISLQRE